MTCALKGSFLRSLLFIVLMPKVLQIFIETIFHQLIFYLAWQRMLLSKSDLNASSQRMQKEGLHVRFNYF